MLVIANRAVLFIVIMLLALWALTGCGPKQVGNTKTSSAGAGYLTITDDAGRRVVLTKKPEKIVALSTSYIELLYAVGGKAVGKPVSRSGKIPAEAASLPELGQVTNINIEKLIALQPDFVIGYLGIHEKLVPILENSGIPIILLKMKTYDEVQAKLNLFGSIADTQLLAQKEVQQLTHKIALVTDKLPAGQTKKILILHATARSVSVELENSIAGNVAGMLKLKNVAAGSKPLEKEPDFTPYSMEKIIEADPDVVMVTTMGELSDIKRRIKDDLESNPAWSGLRAVKNEQVHYLPSELFQLNPGINYHEAVEYMAKVVYPEVYGYVR